MNEGPPRTITPENYMPPPKGFQMHQLIITQAPRTDCTVNGSLAISWSKFPKEKPTEKAQGVCWCLAGGCVTNITLY